MLELSMIIAIVIIAAFYLVKKLHNAFTKPYEGCSNCSCHCNGTDKCDVK
ncbi:MAG: hypothetical protein JXQ65_06405 [Candidatus Marinimicrobia bacterium]|nr:hypothetical protein [Candidatus Neomarinimicrobiota bacterium]